MEQHNGSGRRGSGLAEHFSRMHDRRVEPSHRHDTHSNDPVLCIEHDDAELLDDTGAVMGEEKRRKLARGRESRAVSRASHQRSPTQLNSRDDLGCLGRANSRQMS